MGATGDRAARLVECESCGAGNAESRPLCARCGAPLRDEVPGGDALPPTTGEVPLTHARSESPPVILSLVILAGLITAGVLLALVTSRVTTPDTLDVPAGVVLQSASASTALQDHPASRAIDGDPTTAWTEAQAGPGTQEWIEVTTAEPVRVARLLLWNGDQGDEVAFAENGRAAAVRIEAADRQFRVRLRDVIGPQAIDLPEPVRTDRIRIVVEEALPGARYTDLAISEIVVEAAPE